MPRCPAILSPGCCTGRLRGLPAKSGLRAWFGLPAGFGLLVLTGTPAWAHAPASGWTAGFSAPDATLLLAGLALLLAWVLWQLRGQRLKPGRLAAPLVALLLWVGPVLALHQTHHALETAPVHCPLQAIGHTAGAGCVQAAWAAPALLPEGSASVPAPFAPPARPWLAPVARAPPQAA
ncbi:MAG TPA: hypothetical protein VL359_12875 [bacterium]|nr:hypothetical protein [bacterium]